VRKECQFSWTNVLPS